MSSYSKAPSGGYRQRPKKKGAEYSNQLRNFSRKDLKRAENVFEKRSPRSQAQDLRKFAQPAPNLQVWLKAPNRYDIKGIDTPAVLRRSCREQARDLVKVARKAKKKEPVELQVVRRDLPGGKNHSGQMVPTISRAAAAPRKRTYRVLKKKEAEKEMEPSRVEADAAVLQPQVTKPQDPNSPLISGSRMPSHEEIMRRATEMYMEDQAKVPDLGLGETLPELTELREGGYLREAQIELMSGPAAVGSDAEIRRYIRDLRAELEPQGFTVVPILEVQQP